MQIFMVNLLRKDGTGDKWKAEGPARQLTPKQRQALNLFLSGMNIQMICMTIGTETKTFRTGVKAAKRSNGAWRRRSRVLSRTSGMT